MLCTQCGRDNTAGLDYCDYCGEPLTAAGSAKRKTEMDGGGGGGGGKRKTAMDAPAAPINDPFEAAMSGQVEDPFAPSAGAGKKPAAPATPAAAPAKKRVTQFDQGDPFAPPSAVAPEDNRRIVGFLITFDRHPTGKHFLIREGRNLLGRDADRCEIVVEGDDKVSSQHAVLVWRNGRLRLADDKSQNGTFLDEEDVLQPEEVADGAVIRLGGTRLICRLLDQAKVDQLWKLTEGG